MELIPALVAAFFLYLILGFFKVMTWLGIQLEWLMAQIAEHGVILAIWGLGIATGTVLLLRVRKILRMHSPKPAAADTNIQRTLRIWSCVFLCYYAFEVTSMLKFFNQPPSQDLGLPVWSSWDFAPGIIQLTLLIMAAVAMFRLKTATLLLSAASFTIFVSNLVAVLVNHPGFITETATIAFSTIKQGLPLAVALYGWRKGGLMR